MTKELDKYESITVVITSGHRAKLEQAAVDEGVKRKGQGGLSAIVRNALDLYFSRTKKK